MELYIAIFNNGTETGDKFVYIEAESALDAAYKAEALYIVMPSSEYELMLVDTAEVVLSL